MKKVLVAKLSALGCILSTITLVVLSADNLQAQPSAVPTGAQVQMKVTLQATATIQGADNGGSPVDKLLAPTTVKITTEWLLQQIATDTGTTIPTTALLWYDSTLDIFYVTDHTGTNDLGVDTSGLFVALDPDFLGVWQGQVNNNTSAASYTGSYLLQFSYQGTSYSFSINGLAQEKFSLTAQTATNSNQNGTDSITLSNGVGDGSYTDSNGNQSNLAISSGKVTATGSGVSGAGETAQQPDLRPNPHTIKTAL